MPSTMFGGTMRDAGLARRALFPFVNINRRHDLVSAMMLSPKGGWRIWLIGGIQLGPASSGGDPSAPSVEV